jgi:hypothetical protein
MARSWTRTAYMDLSYPYVINFVKITTPYPKEKSRLLAPIRPFDTIVTYLKPKFI